MPPLLAPPLPCPVVNQFHTVSDCHVPPGPLVLKVVAPTTVTFGSSDGGLRLTGLPDAVNAPLSPDARKNDCPWVAYCWKICSVFESMSNPHEQLNCSARLSVAMRFKMSLGIVILL